ncbi:Calcium channel YVC1 [Nakaseomyces bracarensis]|uniref:Calcium channel YVC1 n=1 Tax=Nakaseomyces bracarensis TaxID=273131 RepID=A0ABR4NMN4_9SACH
MEAIDRLPIDSQDCQPENCGSISLEAPSSRQILRIALNLKYLIDTAVHVTYDVAEIESDHSTVVTDEVVELAIKACGGDPNDQKSLDKYRSVVIYSLLKVYSWYTKLADAELHNAELYAVRGVAAQQICKLIIDREERNDLCFMFMQMLLRRYTISENDEDSEPANAIELASDMHCTIVIASGGFQRCLTWLWRGWIIQNRKDPSTFIRDESISSPYFLDHFEPERIKTPKYQNILNIFFSILFLILYTMVVNGKSSSVVAPVDFTEAIFYLFTLGNILDELTKLYYIGTAFLSFWSSFNLTMYAIITLSFVMRLFSVTTLRSDKKQEYWDKISYRILSCAAPFVWSRMLLFLESERFVGVMLVVLKHMMKESAVFFVLLVLIMIGFCQGFLGLDSSDGHRDVTGMIMENLTIAVLGLGSFDKFKRFAPPYAEILYYSYYFIVSVVLLNILIALFTNAYQKVVDNAADEYMALMAQKCLRFIRAPDEDVFVAPLNLIEILLCPIIKVLPKKQRNKFSYYVMLIMYSPTLFVIAITETRTAKRIKYNRMKKLADDANEIDTPWDLTDGYIEEEDRLLSGSHSNGAQATVRRNKFSLQVQRDAEAKDPKFSVDKTWYSSVKKLSHSEENKADEKMIDLTNSGSVEISNSLAELNKNLKKLLSSNLVHSGDNLEHIKDKLDEISDLNELVKDISVLGKEIRDIAEMKDILKELAKK